MSEAGTNRAVRMLISGRVQGVSFRWFTRRAAERLGLVGWVRNLPDGRVEVRAAGASARLEELRRQLRQGPPGSRVDDISESELSAAEEWTRFEITF